MVLEKELMGVYEAHVPSDAQAHPDAFAGVPSVAAATGYGSDDSGYSASFATASFASLDLSVNSNPGLGDAATFPPVAGVYVWDKAPKLRPDPVPPLATPAAMSDTQSVSEVTTAQTPDMDALVAKLDQVQAENKAKEATIAQQGVDITQLTAQISSLQTSIAQQSQQIAALLAFLNPVGTSPPVMAGATPPTTAPAPPSKPATPAGLVIAGGVGCPTSAAKRPPPGEADLQEPGGKHFRKDG